MRTRSNARRQDALFHDLLVAQECGSAQTTRNPKARGSAPHYPCARVSAPWEFLEATPAERAALRDRTAVLALPFVSAATPNRNRSVRRVKIGRAHV